MSNCCSVEFSSILVVQRAFVCGQCITNNLFYIKCTLLIIHDQVKWSAPITCPTACPQFPSTTLHYLWTHLAWGSTNLTWLSLSQTTRFPDARRLWGCGAMRARDLRPELTGSGENVNYVYLIHLLGKWFSLIIFMPRWYVRMYVSLCMLVCVCVCWTQMEFAGFGKQIFGGFSAKFSSIFFFDFLLCTSFLY